MAYVTEKRGVHYAVIYEGRNPVTGRERRRWHRCESLLATMAAYRPEPISKWLKDAQQL